MDGTVLYITFSPVFLSLEEKEVGTSSSGLGAIVGDGHDE